MHLKQLVLAQAVRILVSEEVKSDTAENKNKNKTFSNHFCVAQGPFASQNFLPAHSTGSC